MKILLRTTVNTAFALFICAAAFAQHYTETKLVSNTSGVAEVTDPQLVNSWGLAQRFRQRLVGLRQQNGFPTQYHRTLCRIE